MFKNKNLTMIPFFLLTFGISWLLWFPAMAASLGWVEIDSKFTLQLLGFLGAFGPSIAAVFLTWQENGKIGLIAWIRQGLKLRIGIFGYLISLGLLPVLAGLALVNHALLFGQVTDRAALLLAGQTMIVAFPVLLIIGGPFGEEFGWRGYALNYLLKIWSPVRASLLLGVVHAVWHLPLFFISGTTQQLLTLHLPLVGWFIIGVVALSFFYTWLYEMRQSVWSALLFHNMVNLTYLGLTITQMNIGSGALNLAALNPDLINVSAYTQVIAIFDILLLIGVSFLVVRWRQTALNR